MSITQFNFKKSPKPRGSSADQARELALLMDALISTTGLRPRPGQTLGMALMKRGLTLTPRPWCRCQVFRWRPCRASP
jgi:hypothetical protein